VSKIELWRMIMNFWKDDEVVALFEEVEKTKQKSLPMKRAFDIHAQKFGRKSNSVRNYYYFELESLHNDENRCKKLKINLKNHKKNHFELFDRSQEVDMVEKIDKLLALGLSVRGACFKLANGDLTMMTRFQNKYQNIKRKCGLGKIIKFENKQKSLTDSDINSLFLGLVKLIKKTAIEEYSQNEIQENASANFMLKKTLADLKKKDRQIAQMREDYEFLKKENERLNMRLISPKEDIKSQFVKSRDLKKENI